ncbi:hypothetical protein GC093_02000 [Paenibacillus sp. LMG 31456]|uniref:Nucleotidyltransferase family protein n=1 Tax=Paenibacillus foliorum TaxID=2654974 RepID=A0A972GPH1_9BACL|nr:hypothetical protein [Paenibacillus foliorum]NOU92009.1 hypothetical protein [Paenibacillus foliorum]
MALSLDSVQLLMKQLDGSGISYASGGSGLLYSLGLTNQVHDWDLTTDDPYEDVAAALHGWSWTQSSSGDHPFASSYRIHVADQRLPIDMIGQFAIHSQYGICRLPALSSFEWQGIPMGSPEIWAVAYALMNRKPKADMLFSYLQQHNANQDILQLLLAEPLPDFLRSKLLSLI